MSCQNNKCQRDYSNDYFEYNKCHKEDEYNKCHKEDEYNKCHKEDGYNKCHKEDECFKCRREDGGEIHVHEYSSSVKLAEVGNDRHPHRVAGVTGEAILINNGTDHVHKIKDNTDFFDHFHVICVTTGPAINIPGTGKHVHLVYGNTTIFDEHCHPFLFTTQIQAPLLPLQVCIS
jgi:hypothetical protein